MVSVAQHYCTTLLLLVIVHYYCTAQEPGLTDVLVQLSHEGLAEAGDLANRLALGVEVGASLSAPHGQSGQAVLEDLLKAQELDDTQADSAAEPETALHSHVAEARTQCCV